MPDIREDVVKTAHDKGYRDGFKAGALAVLHDLAKGFKRRTYLAEVSLMVAAIETQIECGQWPKEGDDAD